MVKYDQNIIWGNLDLNPTHSSTYPGSQDDFGNDYRMFIHHQQSAIDTSYISASIYGGESIDLAFSKFWQQARSATI